MRVVFSNASADTNVRFNRTWIAIVKQENGTKGFIQFELPRGEKNTKKKALEYFKNNKMQENEEVHKDSIYNIADYQSEVSVEWKTLEKSIIKR